MDPRIPTATAVGSRMQFIARRAKISVLVSLY